MGGAIDEKKVRKTWPRFFIQPRRVQTRDGQLSATMDKDLVHYLRTVLRIGVNQKIILFDGSGREYLAQIVESRPAHVQAKIIETRSPRTESKLEITLGQALLKEQAFDKVLTSATELGVSKIIPVLSKRVVAKINPAEAHKKIYRWEKIIQEAAAQSARVSIPKIEYPVPIDQLLQQNADAQKIILWEKAPGGEIKSPEIMREFFSKNKIRILIGPEGGFEDDEVEKALQAGFITLGLGPRILRAETAPTAALAILQYLFGDLATSS